jgi:hypothetical protein
MKNFRIWTISLLLCAGFAQAETLDEAMGRFLAGETLTPQEVDAITDRQGFEPNADGVRNDGTFYLYRIKCSILDPVKHGGWPLRIDLVDDERGQTKTYRELKAIYQKDKSPVVAYALVCPAMFVNDFDLLPELIAKIGENKHLKAHFDKVYASYWKPRLDPDF